MLIRQLLGAISIVSDVKFVPDMLVFFVGSSKKIERYKRIVVTFLILHFMSK